MDNVTHSLTGLFLSQAGLNRLTPHATLLLILAANAPDLDILALTGGSLNYFHYHRHITHSLFFAPILAIALVAIFRAILHFTRRHAIPWLPAFVAVLIGIASHLLLDLTNDYGERLLLPFSPRWLAGDLCAIYDIWILAFFLLCLAAPLLSKLVGGEIGASARSLYPSRALPWVALIFLLLYDGGRFALHQRALATLDARQYEGAPALRVAAFPDPYNPFHWRGLAETGTAYRLYDLNLLKYFDPTQAQVSFKTETDAATAAASQTEPFRVMADFARFPLWSGVPAELGPRVTLSDIRFSFFAEAHLDRSGKIVNSAFHFSR